MSTSFYSEINRLIVVFKFASVSDLDEFLIVSFRKHWYESIPSSIFVKLNLIFSPNLNWIDQPLSSIGGFCILSPKPLPVIAIFWQNGDNVGILLGSSIGQRRQRIWMQPLADIFYYGSERECGCLFFPRCQPTAIVLLILHVLLDGAL